MAIKKCLIIPDCHRPFHDERAWNLVLEIGSFVGLHEIVFLGDFADFYSVSRHLKDPRMPHMLEKEIESVNEGLDQVDKLWRRAKKVYLFGNHEKRLDTLIHSQAPALHGLAECSKLFGMRERPNWQWQEFDRKQGHKVLGSKLCARHRPLATHPQLGLRKALQSYVYGDIHRIEQTHVVGLSGMDLVAFSPGWLGDKSSRAFDYLSGPAQWQQGFAIVSVDVSSGRFFHEIVQIKNGYAVTHGKVFKA